MTSTRNAYLAIALGVLAIMISISTVVLKVMEKEDPVLMSPDATTQSVVTSVAQPFVIIDVPQAEGPEFRRRYVAPLPGKRIIDIDFYTYYDYTGRPIRKVFHAKVEQEDGRSISFDPKHIADKVLDEALVPFIEERSAAALAIDQAWWTAGPASFSDRSGARWIKEVQ